MALACCMLRCTSDLIHTALVESSNAKRNGNGHPSFLEAAANGNGASHAAVEENSSGIAVQMTRAHNLDKADREYKGRHHTKAQQAALGEVVRQRIASVSQKKDQNISENDGSNPFQSVSSHGEDCKLDVGAGNDSDRHRCNADVDHRKENVVAKTLAASSTGKDSPQSNVPEKVRNSKSVHSSLSALLPKTGFSVPESSEMSWGHSYSYRELEKATDFFSDANILGSGDHAIVYHGVVSNGSHIVLKKLLNNRGQAEKEFKSEVAAIGRIRHKNLVRLIGFCTEGPHRILVYEHIDNGNLEQWLHGPVGKSSPFSWDMRMKTIIGAAKGLAYLHEGLEPKVVHRDIKPSSILLDKLWNAKVSDFGFAKLVGTGKSHATTRVMGTFGYVAPEYASTGMLTEKSDVYSYGVLVMETITGRIPVDRNRAAGEVHLVDWVKSMVGSHCSEEVADPNMGVKPSTRSLKRALLVALRCVDPDASRRPKMSHVVHMLESADDNPFCKEPNIVEVCSQRKSKQLATVMQRHKVFTIPAFMLSQNVMDKSVQGTPNDNWPLFGDGGFVGRINRKASWKYER